MGTTSIDQGVLKSVAELIDLCERLEGKAFDRPSAAWAYRGQPREFAVLRPSFQRQFEKQSYATAELIEDKLLEGFRKHYGGMPDRSADMPQPEQIGPGHDMRCLSVMQHYEIPTRLLDWTTNFWTAIYFACASDPGSTAELWCYNRSIFGRQRELNPQWNVFVDHSVSGREEPAFRILRGENLLVEVDPQISPRMRQQFAHHTVSASVFSDHAPLLIALEREMSRDQSSDPLVQRWVIDGACKGKALQFLADSLNITASTIFPDVVGLGRFLRWQFDSLRTMLM